MRLWIDCWQEEKVRVLNVQAGGPDKFIATNMVNTLEVEP